MGVKIITKPYGEMEVDEKQMITFPDGILGFDFVRKFILLDMNDTGSPFKWLQAYEEPDLAFIIIQPTDFLAEYELALSQSDLDAVDATSLNGLLVFAIVTIPENPSDMTANLQGPLIINPKSRLGRQAISLSDKYHVRHRILDEMRNPAPRGG